VSAHARTTGTSICTDLTKNLPCFMWWGLCAQVWSLVGVLEAADLVLWVDVSTPGEGGVRM